jgi:hypothetical protein
MLRKTNMKKRPSSSSVYSVQIRCEECNAERWVKPQDAGIVTRCKEHQRLRTLQLRRSRAQRNRQEQLRTIKNWRGQVQTLAKKTNLSKTQTSEILMFFERVVGSKVPTRRVPEMRARF